MPRIGERLVMGKHMSTEPNKELTIDMAKAVLSTTEYGHRQNEILESM